MVQKAVCLDSAQGESTSAWSSTVLLSNVQWKIECMEEGKAGQVRRESKAERAAWTEFVQGADSDPKANKYGAVRKNGYASKHEADAAAKYQLLASRGIIREYQEQFRITLVPGNGKLRPVVYVADFKYIDDDGLHIVDTKSVFTAKLPVYRLKNVWLL